MSKADKKDKKRLSPRTLTVHGASQVEEGIAKSKVPPLFATTVFKFESFEELDRAWDHHEGYVYSRMDNPSVRQLEELVALLEGCDDAVAFASGMGAITTSLLSLLKPGDHVVAENVLYGGTFTFFKEELLRNGVEVSFADTTDLEAVRQACRFNTSLIYTETITNPLMEVAPLSELGALAQEKGAILAVDNTFASPLLCHPGEHGADLVLHSSTKYINGHSDVTGGIAAGSREIMELVRRGKTLRGACMSPFDAWLTLRGARTLALRMRQHSKNALALAEALEKNEKILKVHYPGLLSHPQHDLARAQFGKDCGGMLSVEIRGGLPEVNRLIKELQLVQFVPSLACLSTTISPPARTSHRSLSPEERQARGITDGLVRISAGIEDVKDIIQDFEEALRTI
jgi:cystathionine beta-lyase/cystathionine gamma-synthase